MPLATVMRALFTRGGLGYYHSPIHLLPDPILHNPIRIVDLETGTWWEHPEEILGKRDLQKVRSYVVEAWNCLRMDDVLASAGNMSREEGLLACYFLELATKCGTYPDRSLAVVTTHYGQMVWLRHCVEFVGRRMCHGRHPILLAVATLDWFQGLQAQVILDSLVSAVLAIMSNVWRPNTLTSRAQSELHLFGRFGT